jgi:hypothetical protein
LKRLDKKQLNITHFVSEFVKIIENIRANNDFQEANLRKI